MPFGEQGILVYRLKESTMKNIGFNNVRLNMRKGKETMGYGGIFDLRPASPKSMQIFEHDISGMYAQFVNGLTIRNFQLSCGANLHSFFTYSIEREKLNDLVIVEFAGTANPITPGNKKISIENSRCRK